MKRIIENGKTVGYAHKGLYIYRIDFTIFREHDWMVFDPSNPFVSHARTLAEAKARIEYKLKKEVAKNETN